MDGGLGQAPQRGDPEALAGLAQGRARGDPTGASWLEPAEDLAVAVAAAQAEGHDEPDHEPARQPRAGGAAATEAGFHVGAGQDTLQRAGSLAGGPRREVAGLLADVDHRSLLVSAELWQTQPARRLP
jgi:hypothetical protein